MEVKIIDLGINGEGVAKAQIGDMCDKVCFVNFALPNEKVDVDIIKDKSKFCVCKVNRIIEPCDDRIEPKCPYFAKCGGCDLQHLNLLGQRKFKRDKVSSSLRKVIPTFDVVADTQYGEEWGYRNKMVFAVREECGKTKIGMFEGNSHRVVEISRCLLTSDAINDIYSISREYILKSNYIGYNEKTGRGDIKYIVIRGYGDSYLVTIVATRKLKLDGYYNALQGRIANIGLSILISNSDDEILSGKYYHLFGLEKLAIEEFGINYSVDNLGFLQVNNQMKEKMYSRVLEELDNNTNIIDAYSGAGLLSAIVSKKAKSVVGIEINKSASRSATRLTRVNNINNIKFINDDIVNALDEVVDGVQNVSVILDPPRSGCDRRVCNKLIDKYDNINKIIYISCNPATLARDLEILCAKFKIKSVTPYDLFPQTKHIETLVVLDRN